MCNSVLVCRGGKNCFQIANDFSLTLVGPSQKGRKENDRSQLPSRAIPGFFLSHSSSTVIRPVVVLKRGQAASYFFVKYSFCDTMFSVNSRAG